MAGQPSAWEHVVYFGTDGWEGMLAQGREVPAGRVGSDDVTNIQYTSGTTGSPKGVLLTHRNVLNNAAVIAEGMRISENDRIVVPVPLYHCFGCVIGTLVSVVTGATHDTSGGDFRCAVRHWRRFTKNERRRFMEYQPCSSRNWNIRLSRTFDFSSLRTGMMAGAPCPVEIMRRVVERDAL